jgi:DNA modification methylase
MTFEEIIKGIGEKPYFQDDAVVIYNADCRDILPLIPDKSIDLVLTDPPYGLGAKLHDGGTWSTAKKYDAMLDWDKSCVESELVISLTKYPSIIWGGNLYPLPQSRCWLAWIKYNNVPTMADFELAWTNFDRPSKKCAGRIHPDGINQHPTQKPEYLICFSIEWSKSQGIILDPFLGSGTTAVAAKKLGRKCIGIEIEEKYCEIAVNRCRQSVMRLE